MSSLVSNLNNLTVIGSEAQEVVNWVTIDDFALGKFVQTHRNYSQLVANSVQSRRRCLFGIAATLPDHIMQ